MAKAVVPIRTFNRAGGLDLTAVDTALDGSDGAKVPNDGRTYIQIFNSGESAHVVTFQTPQTVAGLAIADATVTVAAGKWSEPLGPWPTETFNVQSGADGGHIIVTADNTQSEVSLIAYRGA
jgi:hypothetical protein